MLSHAHLAAFVSTLIWGLVVLIVRGIKSPAYLGVVFSMSAGILILLPIAYFTGHVIFTPAIFTTRDGLWLILGGVFQFPLASICYYEMLKSAELSLAVPLTRLKAVFVVVLALIFRLDDFTFKIVGACVLAVLGAGILSWQPRSGGGAGMVSVGQGRSIVMAILTSVSWSLGDILIRLALRSFPALSSTIMSLGAGALVYLVGLTFAGRLWSVWRLPMRDMVRFALHGVLSFGLAFYLFFYAMEHIGASRATIITSGWPLVSCVVGLVFLREKLYWRKVVGIVLIMVSVGLVV